MSPRCPPDPSHARSPWGDPSRCLGSSLNFPTPLSIEAHNAEFDRGIHTYRLGVNAFSDLTLAEFKALYLHPLNRTLPRNDIFLPMVQDNTTVDWRNKSAVTPVMSQGQCGSCWAFSSVGVIEGIWAIVHKQLIQLSAQQLMDCSDGYGNQGCEGGLMDASFRYVIANGGLDSEADYPYVGRDQTCDVTKQRRTVSHITSYADIPANNEAQLIAAVSKQPVAVAMDASDESFVMYQSGVYNGPCDASNVDHTLLVVGYTDTYFIAKNS